MTHLGSLQGLHLLPQLVPLLLNGLALLDRSPQLGSQTLALPDLGCQLIDIPRFWFLASRTVRLRIVGHAIDRSTSTWPQWSRCVPASVSFANAS